MADNPFAQFLDPTMSSPAGPLLKMLLTYLADSALTGSSSMLRFSTMDASRSIEANWQAARNSQMQATLFGNLASQQSKAMTTQLMEGFYQTLGYDAVAARYNAGRTGAGILGWGINETLGRQWKQGLGNLYSAAFERRAYEAPDGNFYRMRSDYARVGDRLLQMHYQQGAFGPASFAEVGAVAASLISSGRYDYMLGTGGRRAVTDARGNYIDAQGNRITDEAVLDRMRREAPSGGEFWEQDNSGAWNISSRSSKIAQDVRAYSKALTTLQDVLGGDMNQVLDTLDKLFGSNATAISAPRLQNIANNLRHSMASTGVGLQAMATMAGVGFGYIGPYGGTEIQGLQMANTASYFLGAGLSVEGVKGDVYGSSLLMHQANRIVSGDARYMAAAYTVYADKNNLDVHAADSYRRFTEALGSTSRTAGSLNEWMRNLAGPGNDAYLTSVLNSDRTTALIGEFDITMDMMQQDVARANRTREAQYRQLVETYNKSAGTSFSVNELIGGDFALMDSEQVFNAVYNSVLGSNGGNRTEARRLAEQAAKIQRNTARSVFYGMTGAEAEQTMVNARKAQRARNTSMFRDEMISVYGDAIAGLTDSQRAGGLEGVFQSIISRTAPGSENRANVTDILLGAIGLTSEQIKAFGTIDDLSNQTALREFFSGNYDTVADQYKRIMGRSFKTTGDRDADLASMSKELMQTALRTQLVSPAIWRGMMRGDAVIPEGSGSYEQLRSRALTASMVLQREGLSETDRLAAEKDLKNWADVTEGDEARLISVAVATNRTKDLWSSTGRDALQKELDIQNRIEEYVDRSGFGKGSDPAKRRGLIGTVRRLYDAAGALTGEQRSALSKSIQVQNGQVSFDADMLNGMSSDALTVAQQSIIDLIRQQSGRGVSDTTLTEMARDPLKLLDSNDPIAQLITMLREMLGEIINKLPGNGMPGVGTG